MRHAERFSPAGVHYTSIYNMKNKKEPKSLMLEERLSK